MELEKIIDVLSTFADYLKNFYPQCRERDTAITRLEEAVFWLTYLNEEEA